MSIQDGLDTILQSVGVIYWATINSYWKCLTTLWQGPPNCKQRTVKTVHIIWNFVRTVRKVRIIRQRTVHFFEIVEQYEQERIQSSGDSAIWAVFEVVWNIKSSICCQHCITNNVMSNIARRDHVRNQIFIGWSRVFCQWGSEKSLQSIVFFQEL